MCFKLIMQVKMQVKTKNPSLLYWQGGKIYIFLRLTLTWRLFTDLSIFLRISRMMK